MDHLVRAVRGSVSTSNWYAALSLGLTLPDICGRLEDPAVTGRKRYIDWCEKYLAPVYTHPMPDGPHKFLGGKDCYALRCAVLHEGRDDIMEQSARDALDSFIFVIPPTWGMIHCNQINNKLQLQVDIFCEDLCSGVEKWMLDNRENKAVVEGIQQLMKIIDTSNGLSL